ncbi:MAG TPA: amino acid permease [Phycisphaerales bacterium]|nr:amino acid permease [Phycisphaerales bacterium]
MSDTKPAAGMGSGRTVQSPSRVLGTFDASCIVIGAIIGVGIFFSPGGVVRATGDGTLALIAWCVAGVMALCGALVFAELGSRFNASGAQYEILRGTYGRLPAFAYVFCNATAIQAGAVAIIAAICVQNLARALGNPPPEGNQMVVQGAILILGIMGANIAGVKIGSAIQNFTVIAKVLTLLLVTGLALMSDGIAGSEATVLPEPRDRGAVSLVLSALAPAFFAFGGWQHALWISGEVKNPVRTLPRAIFGGVVVVVIVYLLANWSYLHLLGERGVYESKALAADAVGRAWPQYGARIIAGAVALSAFGVLNAQLLSGPRLVHRMATEGQFFHAFARLGKAGTPWAAIMLIALIGIGLLATIRTIEGIDTLCNGVVFIDGVFFALTAISLLVIRAREKKILQAGQATAQGVFRVPFSPVIPLVFIVGEFGLLAGTYLSESMRQAAWIGIAWMFLAIAMYLMFFRRGV